MDKNLNKKKKKYYLYGGAIAAAVLLLGLVITTIVLMKQVNDTRLENEQLALENQQLNLANEYEQLNTEFQNYENQSKYLTNDSLVEKYAEAKDKVEKLLVELKTQKITSERRIRELQSEIATLKGIMRHYVEQIEALGRENAGLKAENQEIRRENTKLNTQVSEVTRQNEELNERMTLAEKLNISGLSLQALKSNGKKEKRISKAKQLQVTFTIPQNNSTPVGSKVIYMRLTNPEGSLLGESGKFEFEGSKIAFTERKTIEYEGKEIQGITIYWNVNTALTPGKYIVELFCDNYRIGRNSLTFEK